METEKILFEIVNRIGKTQDEMQKTLIRIEADLSYHIKRTDLLEKKIAEPFPWKTVATIVSTMSGLTVIIMKLLGN